MAPTPSRTLQELLTGLRQRGFHPPTFSRATITQWVAAKLVVARRALRDALQLMRSERQARWEDLVPKLWQDRPSVPYRWLEGNSPAWGCVPIQTATGMQCTTVQEVDGAVKGYWVGIGSASIAPPSGPCRAFPKAGGRMASSAGTSAPLEVQSS